MPPTTSSATITLMIRPMGDPAACCSVGMAATGSSVGVGVRVGFPGTSAGVGVAVSGTGVGVAVSDTEVGVTVDGASVGVGVGILGTGDVGIGVAVSAGVGIGVAAGGAADHTRAKVEKWVTEAEKTRLVMSNEVRKEVQWPPSSDGWNRWMLSLPEANSPKTEPRPPISWTSASVSIALSVALNQKFTLRIGLPAASNSSTWMTRRACPSGGTTKESVGGARSLT